MFSITKHLQNSNNTGNGVSRVLLLVFMPTKVRLQKTMKIEIL